MTEEIRRGRTEPDGPIHVPAGAADPRRIADQSTDWVEGALRDYWATYPPTDLELAHRERVDWQAEIARWQQFIDEMMPPRLTEPIKLTPGQWALLPHGDPRIPIGGQIGDLFGVSVVMVEDEAESTTVAEGWIEPRPPESRRERRRRLGLHWWQRETQ